MSARPDPDAEHWSAVDAERADLLPGAPVRTRLARPEGGRDTGPHGAAPAGAAPAGDEASPDGGTAGEPREPGAPDRPGTAGVSAEPGVPEGGTILTDVAALEAERDEYLRALQRLKADFDNYRKRVLRQQDEQAARAAGALVAKLLPVIDNLDLAWAHLGQVGDGDVSEEARALAQARSQLLDVLAREGLERVDEVGVPFDPVVHDAVAHSPAPAAAAPEHAPGPDAPGAEETGPQAGGATDGGGTGADGQASGGQGIEAEALTAGPSAGYGVSVEEVMRAGYRWRGQVLRPAMVRVRG